MDEHLASIKKFQWPPPIVLAVLVIKHQDELIIKLWWNLLSNFGDILNVKRI